MGPFYYALVDYISIWNVEPPLHKSLKKKNPADWNGPLTTSTEDDRRSLLVKRCAGKIVYDLRRLRREETTETRRRMRSSFNCDVLCIGTLLIIIGLSSVIKM